MKEKGHSPFRRKEGALCGRQLAEFYVDSPVKLVKAMGKDRFCSVGHDTSQARKDGVAIGIQDQKLAISSPSIPVSRVVTCWLCVFLALELLI